MLQNDESISKVHKIVNSVYKLKLGAILKLKVYLIGIFYMAFIFSIILLSYIIGFEDFKKVLGI